MINIGNDFNLVINENYIGKQKYEPRKARYIYYRLSNGLKNTGHIYIYNNYYLKSLKGDRVFIETLKTLKKCIDVKDKLKVYIKVYTKTVNNEVQLQSYMRKD